MSVDASPTASLSRHGKPSSRTISVSPTIRMEAHYIGFNMWVKAVEKPAPPTPTRCRRRSSVLPYPNLTGGLSAMMPNHHITKPVLIGEIQEDGQFVVVMADLRSGCRRRLVRFPAGLQDIIADWESTAKLWKLQRKDGQMLWSELRVT